MRIRHSPFPRSGTNACLTRLILLVCMSVFINDFHDRLQSIGSSWYVVEASNFRFHDAARDAGGDGASSNSGEKPDTNQEPHQTQSTAFGKTSGSASGDPSQSEEATKSKVGKLTYTPTDHLSLFELFNLTRARHQLGAADKRGGVKNDQQERVQAQHHQITEQKPEIHSGSKEVTRVVGAGNQRFPSNMMPTAQGGDSGEVELPPAAPSRASPLLLPRPSSPPLGPVAEQATPWFPSPGTEPLTPPVTPARLPHATLPGLSSEESAAAGETALHWEELSRQHQQMLLSRNLTSVIKLFVDFTQPDHMTPWQMQPPRRCTGSAFVIEGRLLLTNGHLVDWQTRVLARRHGNAKKFNASVVAVAHDCDLALLTVASEEFWEGLRPLTFGQIPQLRDTVTLLGYPTGGDQLSITEGVVSRVGMSKYVHSSYELLTVQIDAAINPGNSGGPALVAGRVVGVAFQGFSELQSIGYIVPYPVIRHFLNDLALHQRFTGFPTLGIKVANLENQGMREYKQLATVKPSDLPEGVTATGVIVVDVDSLRRERYLSGKLRLPHSSALLPPNARIKYLLPESPPSSTPPLSSSFPVAAAPTPETAFSSKLHSPLFGGSGCTVVPPAAAATPTPPASKDVQPHSKGPSSGPSLGLVPGSLLSTSAAERQEAGPAAAIGNASSDASRPAFHFTDTFPTSGFHRSSYKEQQQQQQKKNEQEEKQQQQDGDATAETEKKVPTREDDFLVPNPKFDPQAAVNPELVGLKIGDVILAIDGVDIADDGTVPFRDMERIQLEFTLMYRFNGECSTALILRDGRLMNVLVPLTSPNVVIPMHTWDVKPKYFVFGGLVFVQLTKSLMILPSELTIGYAYAPSIVRKVQGQSVRNFEELVRLVEGCTDQFLEFIVEIEACAHVPIVLDRVKAMELNPKIHEQQAIPRDRSVFL